MRQAAGQEYKQTTKFVYLGATGCENAGLADEIDRRVLLANLLRFRRRTVVCHTVVRIAHHTHTAPAQKYGRMTKAEVMDGDHAIRGCVAWSPTVWPTSRHTTADSSPPTLLLFAASEGRENLATATLCFHAQTRWPRLCEGVTYQVLSYSGKRPIDYPAQG